MPLLIACVLLLEATVEALRTGEVFFHAETTRQVGETNMVYQRDPAGVMFELIEHRGNLTLATLCATHTIRLKFCACSPIGGVLPQLVRAW